MRKLKADKADKVLKTPLLKTIHTCFVIYRYLYSALGVCQSFAVGIETRSKLQYLLVLLQSKHDINLVSRGTVKNLYLEKMPRNQNNLWCSVRCPTNAANPSRSMQNPRTSPKKSEKISSVISAILRNFSALRLLSFFFSMHPIFSFIQHANVIIR